MGENPIGVTWEGAFAPFHLGGEILVGQGGGEICRGKQGITEQQDALSFAADLEPLPNRLKTHPPPP